MKITTVLIITVLTLALTAPTASAISSKSARVAVQLAAEMTFMAFTETKPTIHVYCRVDRRFHAKCAGRYRGDRLNAKFHATVTQKVDGYIVRFSRLRTE